MIFIGIDNGVSGSIGIIKDGKAVAYVHTPTKCEQSYTKEKQAITRIDVGGLHRFLKLYIVDADTSGIVVTLERPMINPMRFKQSISAARSLEATLIVFESLKLPFSYADSKHWQKELLPHGLKDNEIKKASLQVGKRLFPMLQFDGFEDADGILLAEYVRRHYVT